MDLKAVHEGIQKFKRRKRIGRGPGSKKGRTATKGNKGQYSRSGDNPSLLKEGGQMPLYRRLPKRGFNNKWKLVFAVVNVVDLENFEEGEIVSLEALTESGLTKRPHDRVKILGDGELAKRLEVHAHSFSKSAKEKIEKAGGTCVVVEGPHSGPKIRNKMRPRKPKNAEA
ncbi:50S ribosomal protein L15 [Planctomycetes bacterium Pan216]|uniref:Large ribosomal subunit protein uL15 n=1 Tax=Kolteria novifilia TaxID=2527975 RepID=A0A518AZK3_9BACT|nr:50S ribosomal protein L15 [Planctomycetes bacterium Pan216]